MMDRDTQLAWLGTFNELIKEDRLILQRMLSRLGQGAVFPWYPGGPLTENKYSYDELFDDDNAEWNEDDCCWDGEFEMEREVKPLEVNNSFKITVIPSSSLGSFTVGPDPSLSLADNVICYGNGWTQIKNKEEDNMITQIETERKYLNNRLNNIASDKTTEAYNHFNVDYYPRPKDGKELKEWVAAGRIEVNPELKDDTRVAEWGRVTDYLQFTDPDKKADPKAYRKVSEAIYADLPAIKDVIAIADPKDALVAVQEFAKRTYH